MGLHGFLLLPVAHKHVQECKEAVHLTGNVPVCRTSLVSSTACQRQESPQGTTYHQLLRLHELQPWTGRRTSPRLRILAQVRAKTCASSGVERARPRAVSAPRGGCLVFRGTRGQVGPFTCPSAGGGGAGELSGAPEAVLCRGAGPHGTPSPRSWSQPVGCSPAVCLLHQRGQQIQ